MITIAKLWSMMSINSTFFQTFHTVFEELVVGSSKTLGQLKRLSLNCSTKLRLYSTVTLVTIWLFTSFIFSSCLRETLLTLYLDQDYEPNINSVTDLMKMKDISIEIMKRDMDKFNKLLGLDHSKVQGRYKFVSLKQPAEQLELVQTISKGKGRFHK